MNGSLWAGLAPWLLCGCIGTVGAQRTELELRQHPELRQSSLPIEARPLLGQADQGLGTDAVLLLHGWSSSPADFGMLPASLAASGMRVSAPLLAAHGTSPFDLERITADELEASALAAFDALHATAERIHVVGFSMGGSLAVLTASQRPAASLTLVAPFFGITSRPWTILPISTWSSVLWPILRFVPAREAPNWRYDWLPVRSVPRLAELGRRASDPDRLAGLQMPALVILSSADSAASPAAAVRAFGALGSPDARLEFVHNSDHVLLLQDDAALVERLCLEFLNRQGLP